MFKKEQIIRMLEFYYEVDIGNCEMTTKDWIDVVVQALTEEDFMIHFIDDFMEYLGEREMTLVEFFKK